jgi:transposase-like protein
MPGRKKWASQEKAKIVMETLTTNIPLSEICRKYNVGASQVYKWRDRFLEGGTRALAGNDSSDREKQMELENSRLKEMVADLSLANQILKKGQIRS